MRVLISSFFSFHTIRKRSSQHQMLLPYTHTHTHGHMRWIREKSAAGDGRHSKPHNFIKQSLQSDYPSSVTGLCMRTHLLAVCWPIVCVWVCDNVSVILSPMWPHRITTVNPPSGIPIETCNTLTHTHTHNTLAARWLCRSCHCPSGEQQRGVTSPSLLFIEGASAPVTPIRLSGRHVWKHQMRQTDKDSFIIDQHTPTQPPSHKNPLLRLRLS